VIIEKSSGNVFADLDVEDAEELQARAMIGYHVIQLLKDKNMKQKELAEVLGVKQAEISHLLNGHFSRFTTDKLLDFLKRMNLKVTIRISHHKSGEPYQNVSFDDNQKQGHRAKSQDWKKSSDRR
jgi:predicted XRE-type DNA-binding protein